MKNNFYDVALLLVCLWLPGAQHCRAQELFVYTEPASNMPAHTTGLRATSWLMGERGTDRINYHLIPELMRGIGKRWMIHAEGYFSNRSGALSAEGAGLYAKYRFYSKDTLYRHLRAAAFARVAVNSADIDQEELAVNGHNTGMQLGAVITQLLHRQALSATLYYERAADNIDGHEYPALQSRDALNIALSAGRLFYPKQYTGYANLNVNGMVEVLGQQLIGGSYYVDLAAAVQLIINSQTRIDIGYRMEAAGTMARTAPNGLLLRIEHLVFR